MSAPEKGSDASTGAADADTGATTARPVLRVVSGNPTPEEIAVITAVGAAASAGQLEAVRDSIDGARARIDQQLRLIERAKGPAA